MAAGTKCFMRLQTSPSPNTDVDEFYLRYLNRTSYTTKKRIVLMYEGTASNGYAQMSIPNAVFDGTTTPIIVYAISDSVNDTNTGGAGHAEKVTIIGIDENSALTQETVELDGTTEVATTTLWRRIFHAYVSEHGSGGDDAAGNITITNTGQVATYLTIAAGVNESDGAKIWLDEGMIIHQSLHHHDLTTTANATRKVRIKYWLKGIGNMGSDPDFSPLEYTSTQDASAHECGNCSFVATQDDASVDAFETYIGGAEDFKMMAQFWVYYS